MTARQAEEISWNWIATNRWFLILFAALVAGGVEMRVTVTRALAEMEQHVRRPEHDPSARVAIETRLGEIDRRVRNLEGLASETNDLARDSASKADAVLKILKGSSKK